MSFYLPHASEYWSRDPHTLSYYEPSFTLVIAVMQEVRAPAWRFERGIIDELEISRFIACLQFPAISQIRCPKTGSTVRKPRYSYNVDLRAAALVYCIFAS